MQLQERRRQARRDRPVQHAFDTARAFAAPVASSTIAARCRIVAIPIDSAARGTPRRSMPNSAAFARRVAVGQPRAMRRATSASPGSLKPM